MRGYLWRRTASIPLTILLLITLIWIIIEVQPGEFAQVYIGNSKISAAYRETLANDLGLTGPAFLRYLHFLQNIFTGDLGISFSFYPRPVWDIIKERLPRTAVLFLAAFFIQLSVGYLVGRAIGWRRQGALDYGGTIAAAVFWCSFLPLLTSMLIWVFSMRLGLLPPSKFVSVEILIQHPEVSINRIFDYIIAGGSGLLLILYRTRRAIARLARPWGVRLPLYLLLAGAVGSLLGLTTAGQVAWDVLRRMILPIVTLTLVGGGFYVLLMRDSMVETVTEDYVILARAKGLPERAVRNKHAARNALFPIVTSFLLAMAFTLDASIITESIFSWPGIGLALLEAFMEKDMPLAIGIMVFLGVVASFAHLLIDLLYAYLDPRIRYG
jgi:peptide/nickel transport system permease protein